MAFNPAESDHNFTKLRNNLAELSTVWLFIYLDLLLTNLWKITFNLYTLFIIYATVFVQ